jgi:acyl-CoA thioesterase-2
MPSTTSAPSNQWSTAADLLTLLDLEVVDRDIFRGVNTVDAESRPTLYGGQVAAQALRAAGHTVADDRFPHSLHGYFLRPGRPDLPVIFLVDRLRDGGSFSSRHVDAVQNGEAIFSMLASFHRDEDGGQIDALPRREPVPVADGIRRDFEELVEMVEITPTRVEEGRIMFSDHLWVRSPNALPDGRLIHACALTYISDFGTGLGQIKDPSIPQVGPSIDHSLWFHEAIRVDDWVELAMWPDKAGGGRGVYHGTLRDQHGRLGAMMAQEVLMRPSRS